MFFQKDTGAISEAAEDGCLTVQVYEIGPEGLICPECGNRGSRVEEVFRTARVGAPFYLSGTLPTLLEFAPDGEDPANYTYRGRKILTFTDSRQGTARLAARLQQDAERTKARGLIYHNLIAQPHGNPELEEQIRELEKIQKRSPVIQTMFEQLHNSLDQSSTVPFRKLQLGIQHGGVEFDAIRAEYNRYSRDLFGGPAGPGNVAEVLLLREMGRRPKRQNNLETMGLVAVCYPQLAKVGTAPACWTSRRLSDQQWRDFLKLTIDFFVRGGGIFFRTTRRDSAMARVARTALRHRCIHRGRHKF
jgi:hypothetical protein